MSSSFSCSAILTPILLGIGSIATWAQPVTITVDTQKPTHAISPRLVGIFLEDINFGADGGLNSELIKNGGFEFPQSLMGWKKLAGDGSAGVEHEAPRRSTNPNFLALRENGVGIANEGFRGIGVHEGKEYIFNCWARTSSNKKATLKLKLVSDDQVLAETGLTVNDSEWQDLTATLKPSATEAHCCFELVLEEGDSLDLDMVSLCPADTWKDRPHGLRKDIVQLLAELKPAFFRFPGGCIVEGRDLSNRYQWKTTIGDLADRRLIINRWNTEFGHRLTPDYFQSFAVGFYEYFMLSEDVRIELNGANAKCYLDDKLIHDLEIPAPELARVYATASHDQKTGDTIVKVVNVDDEPAETKLNLNGMSDGKLSATTITLSGSPTA
jgi:hypothetical protein